MIARNRLPCLCDGVVDGLWGRVRRRAQGAAAPTSADRRRRPSSSVCVAPLVHRRPKFAGCSLSPETRAMTGLPESGSAAVFDLDATADAAIGARRPGHRHAFMVGCACSGWFPYALSRR